MEDGKYKEDQYHPVCALAPAVVVFGFPGQNFINGATFYHAYVYQKIHLGFSTMIEDCQAIYCTSIITASLRPANVCRIVVSAKPQS